MFRRISISCYDSRGLNATSIAIVLAIVRTDHRRLPVVFEIKTADCLIAYQVARKSLRPDRATRGTSTASG